MLVLVSFGLVLLATILLVVGLLTDDGLTLIYLSIASSFAAAVVLYLAFRRARPSHERATEPPAPLLPELAEGEELEEPEVAAPAEPTRVQAAAPAAPAVDDEPEVQPAPVAAGGDDWSSDDDWATDDDWAEAGEFEVEFPIADYDDLSVAEIMPLLPQLYSDELEVVAARERQGKNRATILARLQELAATGTEADAEVEVAADATTVLPAAAPVPAPAPAPEPVRAAAPAAAAVPAERAPVPAPTVPSLSDDEDDELPFPIADYDELTSDQILPLLAQLEDDELEDVKAREVAGQARKSVISEIDRQLGLVDAGLEPEAANGRGPAPAPAAPTAAPATPAPATPAAATPEPVAAAPVPEARPEPRLEGPDGSVLAISGYDGLTVAQIRPLLSGLSAAELRAVLDHEVARDNRRTIVGDIEKRLAGMSDAPPAAAPAPPVAAARPARPARVAKKAPAKRAAKKAAANHRFPIDDYDRLTVSQIRPKLASLSKAQLEQVRQREATGANRKTVLTEIDRRLS